MRTSNYPELPAPGSVPAAVLLAILAIAAGAALFFVPLTGHETAVITGVGIIASAAALLMRSRRNPTVSQQRLTRILAILIFGLGVTISVLPSIGVAFIPVLIAIALIAHGFVALVHSFQSRSPYVAADAIAAVAGIVFGSLALLWPVLTLSLFRFAVGAWFVFYGLRLLLDISFRKNRSGNDGSRRPTTLRRWGRAIGASLALAVALGLAAGTSVLFGGAPLPAPGAFYEQPGELPSGAGRLIRAEPLSIGVPEGAQAWKILYTTTHADGSPAVSSGTVIAPAQRGISPLPLLTVAHGTTGVTPKCAPSLSSTPFADGAGAALTEMVTQHGWAAVISDYVGLGTTGTHPYLVGDAEARNVLDASRAIQDFKPLNVSSETVIWGHSQGGQAALWSGQIAKDYAPKLTVKGVAAFAPASDLFGLAEANKDEAAGKTVSAYIASTWDVLFPELGLEQHLTPGSARGVDRISNLCFNGADVIGALIAGTQIPNQVFPNQLLSGEFGMKLKAQSPNGPWPAPVFVAQGLSDPLVKPRLQDDWVAGRCRAGEAIEYRTYPGLDHNSLVAADSPLTPLIVQWSLERWADEPATPNCAAPTPPPQ